MITFVRKLNATHPNKKLLVDNPMPLEVSLNVPAANRTFQIIITINDGEATETLEGRFISDICLIDLASLLQAFPATALPDFVLGHANRMKIKFNLEYNVLDENRAVIYNEVDIADYYCWLGGVYVEEYPTRNISPLAHTQLTGKITSFNKLLNEHLYIDAIASDLQISATIFVKEGPNIVNSEDLSLLPRPVIYPLARLLPIPYDAWRVVVVISSGAISQTLTYHIDNTVRRHERDFFFQNSLGGFDFITFTGQRTKMTNTERKTAMQDLRYDYKPKSSNNLTYKASQEIGYKQETGYLPKDTLDYLSRELMTSKQVFEVKNNKLIAVTLITDKLEYDEDSIAPQSVSIEYMLGLS